LQQQHILGKRIYKTNGLCLIGISITHNLDAVLQNRLQILNITRILKSQIEKIICGFFLYDTIASLLNMRNFLCISPAGGGGDTLY